MCISYAMQHEFVAIFLPTADQKSYKKPGLSGPQADPAGLVAEDSGKKMAIRLLRKFVPSALG